MKRHLITILLLLTATIVVAKTDNKTGYRPIHNDTFWNTADGRPIYSQGGGIFRFKNPQTGREQYYWYGVRYQEAVLYRERPYQMMPENCRFEGVTCYRSDNLVDWTEVGDVLTAEEVERHTAPTWMGRMGVVYVPEKQLYALVIQHGEGLLFATSKSPEGPFQWYRRRVMTPLIGTPNTGDQTVFTDDDTGKSYLIYSYGRGRNRAYVSEIGLVGDSIDLMDCQEVYQGLGREGNCMFKYKGRYYLCASNLYGWNSSLAYYLVADDIHGPYQPLNDMQVMAGCEKDYGHVTQTGFFVTLHGSEQETVVYCGDRWCNYANNGLGYNQWVPLSFNGTQPVFNSLSSWELDAQTGCWRVGADNNYVLNGSFEADRRIIPNPVKPRQEFLRGWETTIISGNAVSVGDSLSPRLNYALQKEDHPHVIGNHCLQFRDCVPYERRVSQTVTSTPSVPLPAGTYTLRCKVRGGENFEQLDVVVTADGETHRQRITPHSQWTTITLSGVPIHNGQAEVGFHVRGQANAWCLIDDVELTKNDALISDLVASEYMGTLTRKAHEYGLRTWCEPYAHSPFPGNSITYGSAADGVAAEFWVNDKKYRQKEVDAALGAARASGKNKVWAESFTDGSWDNWTSPTRVLPMPVCWTMAPSSASPQTRALS